MYAICCCFFFFNEKKNVKVLSHLIHLIFVLYIFPCFSIFTETWFCTSFRKRHAVFSDFKRKWGNRKKWWEIIGYFMLLLVLLLNNQMCSYFLFFLFILLNEYILSLYFLFILVIKDLRNNFIKCVAQTHYILMEFSHWEIRSCNPRKCMQILKLAVKIFS